MNLTLSNTLTMTSREIAELTEKRHDHVMRDIRKLQIQVREFEACEYETVNPQNQQRYKAFKLGKSASDLLLDRYRGMARVPLSLQESAALKAIEQVLGVSLIRQHRVGPYRLDGYDPKTNTAYEIDEPEHIHRKAHDACREAEIVKMLGCTFVRVQL